MVFKSIDALLSFKKRSSWLLAYSMIFYWNIDILGIIIFWILFTSSNLAGFLWHGSSWGKALPNNCRVGVEVQVFHLNSVDIQGEEGLLITAGKGRDSTYSAGLCWYHLGSKRQECLITVPSVASTDTTEEERHSLLTAGRHWKSWLSPRPPLTLLQWGRIVRCKVRLPTRALMTVNQGKGKMAVGRFSTAQQGRTSWLPTQASLKPPQQGVGEPCHNSMRVEVWALYSALAGMC